MARIFKDPNLDLIERMASSKDDRIWLADATFAQTSNGYWLAWHPDDIGHVAYLAPDHPGDKPAEWIDWWSEPTQETMIAYFESGEIESDPPVGLNMFIQDKDTGEWT
jgi:hypothetical protein